MRKSVKLDVRLFLIPFGMDINAYAMKVSINMVYNAHVKVQWLWDKVVIDVLIDRIPNGNMVIADVNKDTLSMDHNASLIRLAKIDLNSVTLVHSMIHNNKGVYLALLVAWVALIVIVVGNVPLTSISMFNMIYVYRYVGMAKSSIFHVMMAIIMILMAVLGVVRLRKVMYVEEDHQIDQTNVFYIGPHK